MKEVMNLTFKIFGHRGYPVRFPENSLEGFRYVATHGIYGAETDVQRTKDEQLVIMHDEWIDRTTNGRGMIKDYTLEELREFRLANGEPIPTLAEFLAVFVDTDIQIDIEFKTSFNRYLGIEAQTQRMVERAGLAQQTLYCSFNPDSLLEIHNIAPQMERALLVELPELPDWGRIHGIVDSLHTHQYLPDIQIPQRIWSVDDPKQMRAQLHLPYVDGLITNRFELAKDMVEREERLMRDV
ncbi:glycerophosphodiester phosphodiesterase [Lapidilactobacillus achengensis]|uniref:Glycerophosphodiester phosphodiesterase n=1 Tax=Lapidilactobacillus achengensis TaxID=2486000 RepID=A0ABW1UN35_9LACO|nr:glycerophosphodiester phosphodiesterase family protein [Lapidilactobacillus achengensis]